MIINLFCTKNMRLRHWGPSPIFVVDNHIYQHAQHSGELRWVWRQLHSWRTPSLPFDLFTRFLSGLCLSLPILIALALLQTRVLLHLLRGSDLSCVRLHAEGATVSSTISSLRQSKAKVTLNACTVVLEFKMSDSLLNWKAYYLFITAAFECKRTRLCCSANLGQIIWFARLEVCLLRLRCACPIMILLQSVNHVVLARHTENDTFCGACCSVRAHAGCWIISNGSFPISATITIIFFLPTTKAIKDQKYEHACNREQLRQQHKGNKESCAF